MNFHGFSLPDNPLDEIKRVATKGHFDAMPFDIDELLAHPSIDQDIPKATRVRLTRWFSAPDQTTASLVYPPGGGMAWHTNSDRPGWRAYLAWSETGDSGMGWLRDGQVVLDYDTPGWNVRVFRVPAWHCVFARCWRCSIGVRPESLRSLDLEAGQAKKA